MPRVLRLILPMLAFIWAALAMSFAAPANAAPAYYNTPQGYVVYDGYVERRYVAPRKLKKNRSAAQRQRILREQRAYSQRQYSNRIAARPGIERRALSPRAKARIEARRKAQRLARTETRRLQQARIPRLAPEIEFDEPRLRSRAAPRVASLGDVPARRQLQPVSASNVEARIDIASQRMVVKVDGEVRHVWKVSTGRKGFATPRGAYKPQRMHVSYFSRKYYNSPMPYSIFFRGGYAIHGTTAINRLGGPASHGCVRLATGNARTLFQLVKSAGSGRTRIIVT
ncbi:MAG: L,D-transpeptidase [Rhabdaerophilum sp.]